MQQIVRDPFRLSLQICSRWGAQQLWLEGTLFHRRLEGMGTEVCTIAAGTAQLPYTQRCMRRHCDAAAQPYRSMQGKHRTQELKKIHRIMVQPELPAVRQPAMNSRADTLLRDALSRANGR